MGYEYINKLFLNKFPEFGRSYAYFFKDNEVCEEEWQYIFYENLVCVILDILLAMDYSKKRNELLKRLFTFIESMIYSEDIDVVNLTHIAFFEYRDYTWLRKASHFMSENLVEEISEYIPMEGQYIDKPDIDIDEETNDVYGVRIDLYNVFLNYGVKNYEIPGITSIESYDQYKTIGEAKKDNNSAVFLGRFGTSLPYIICPVSKVNCDENTLRSLSEYLVEYDLETKDDNKSISLYIFSILNGEKIWNMNVATHKHTRYNFDIWINPCFKKIEQNIMDVLSSGRLVLLCF